MTQVAKNETYQERRQRVEDAMLTLELTLEEFAAKCAASCDDRFARRDWRVRADDSLNEWVFDVGREQSEEVHTPEQVIKLAYERFCAIQARRGQLNWHSVYVREVEKIYAVAPKPNGNVMVNTAQISVVQDSVDKFWRYGTSYYVGYGGSASGVWFDGNTFESRENAVLAAAEFIREQLRSKEFQGNSDAYRIFSDKLEKFIETAAAAFRQPLLF